MFIHLFIPKICSVLTAFFCSCILPQLGMESVEKLKEALGGSVDALKAESGYELLRTFDKTQSKSDNNTDSEELVKRSIYFLF